MCQQSAIFFGSVIFYFPSNSEYFCLGFAVVFVTKFWWFIPENESHVWNVILPPVISCWCAGSAGNGCEMQRSSHARTHSTQQKWNKYLVSDVDGIGNKDINTNWRQNQKRAEYHIEKRTCTHLINITLHVANSLRYHYKIFYLSRPLSSKEKKNLETIYRVTEQKTEIEIEFENNRHRQSAQAKQNLWQFAMAFPNHPLYFCRDLSQCVSVCGCTYPTYLLPCA